MQLIAPSLEHYRAAPLVALAAGPQASIIYLLFRPYVDEYPRAMMRSEPKPAERADDDEPPRGESRLSLAGLWRLGAVAPARP